MIINVVLDIIPAVFILGALSFVVEVIAAVQRQRRERAAWMASAKRQDKWTMLQKDAYCNAMLDGRSHDEAVRIADWMGEHS